MILGITILSSDDSLVYLNITNVHAFSQDYANLVVEGPEGANNDPTLDIMNFLKFSVLRIYSFRCKSASGSITSL